MATKIQLKRNKDNNFDITAQFSVYLAKGEPFFDATTKKLYVGDGVTCLAELQPISGVSAEQLVDEINADEFTKTINGNRINVEGLAKVASASMADSATTSNLALTANAARNLTAENAIDAVRLGVGCLSLSDTNNTLNSNMVGTQDPQQAIGDGKYKGQLYFKI